MLKKPLLHLNSSQKLPHELKKSGLCSRTFSFPLNENTNETKGDSAKAIYMDFTANSVDSKRFMYPDAGCKGF